MKSDDTRENFEWLVKLLDMKGIDTPRIIVFFRRVEHMSVVFKHVINTLGRKAYVNYKEDGPNDDRNRLIDMFHMKTSDIVKSSICQSYADPCGHIRVVLCTTSFSMGLDVKGVDSVVHINLQNVCFKVCNTKITLSPINTTMVRNISLLCIMALFYHHLYFTWHCYESLNSNLFSQCSPSNKVDSENQAEKKISFKSLLKSNKF